MNPQSVKHSATSQRENFVGSTSLQKQGTIGKKMGPTAVSSTKNGTGQLQKFKTDLRSPPQFMLKKEQQP